MSAEFPDRANTHDENLWLEDIRGEKPLDWVREQNARTLATFDAEKLKATTETIREVYDSDDRIPMVTRRGDWYYNFWQDSSQPRGIWRRTTLESYRTDAPDWDVLLDLDALGAVEGKQWVWGGVDFLAPDYSRALIELSPDGGDAGEIREFDLESKAFIEDGFFVPYAKSGVSWIDENTVFVSTDFGEDSLTTSGYAREVRRWLRGQSLAVAEHIHSVDKNHMTIFVGHDHTPGFERDVIVDMIDFFNRNYYILDGNTPIKIDVPTDAQIQMHRQWLTIQPKSDWDVNGTTYVSGSLLAIELDAYMQGSREFELVFAPDAETSLQSARWTRDHLMLNLIQNVASRVRIATPGADGWTQRDLPTPELQSTSVGPVDDEDSNDFWMTSSGYLQPSTLSLGSIDGNTQPEVIKSAPAMFNADGLHVEQHFATSKDGTKVPYFQISREDIKLDGSNPTSLYAYGGFEISLTPSYDASTGRAWLEDGFVHVVANIRGGGEYGPTWHTGAMRENRHRAYEDFAAVAKDLADRGVASPEHLGCMGGSNGGLLVGNMLTHYPELFGAVVCTVPLLDMKRYVHLNAGASWIAEYGDPDNPDDWAFVQTFSPYHNLREGVSYPPVLFYTATSDDRVGPVQARKMAARMQDRGNEQVWFYENLQGGHGGAADNAERAAMRAMSLEFLRTHLT